jgi:hypothetical protein
MAQALPLILATLAGLALVIVLTALWQSMRVVLLGGSAEDASMRATKAGVGDAQKSRTAAREELLREKNTLLQAIRDVRFEHDLGKVSDADLERLDAQYRVRARSVLAELDAQIAPYRDKARALLGVTEAGASVPTPAVEPAPPAEPVAPVAQTEAKSTTAECPGCSTVNDADAVFCKKCGARMASEAAS